MNVKYITINFQAEDVILEDIPASFSDLAKAVQAAFTTKLPASWMLQYSDKDGDSITLTTEADFEAVAKDFQDFEDMVHLNVVPYTQELSFEENAEFTSDNSENLEVELDESFGVIEKEEECKDPKDLITELDFSGIITVEDQNEKELSVLNVESPEVAKQSMSGVEILTSPISNDKQNEILEGRQAAGKVDSASQINEDYLENSSLFVESSPHMAHSPQKRKITQDKVFKTPVPILEDLKDFRRKSRDTEVQTCEFEGRLIRNISDQPPRTSLDYFEEKCELKAKKVVKVVHSQCYCDGCGMCPLIGVRYRCSVCEDFDFCERCEASKEHPHLFLRIKNPKEYSKIRYSVKGKNSLDDSGNDFSFKDLGRRFKETTFAKVMSNTYGQLPEQAMQTFHKLFRNIKSNISKVYDNSDSDQYESESDDEETSRHDVLPNREKNRK